jgi:hypothetical protein
MSLFDAAGQIGTAKYAYDLPQDAINTLRQSGQRFQTQAEQLGETAASRTAFTPFAVRTGLGSANVGQAGGLDLAGTAQQQGITGNLMGQAETLAEQAPVTAASLFDQLQGMRAGETERSRLELENRLAAQGRLGVNTAAYGGAPEQFALEKALQEQRTSDMLNALQLAPQLQASQTTNVAGLLNAAFTPQQQTLAALQAAAPFAQLSQSGRQGEAEALYKAGIAGLEAQAGSDIGVANLEQARARAFGDALQGLFANRNAEGDAMVSTASSALDYLKGLFGGDANIDAIANASQSAAEQAMGR